MSLGRCGSLLGLEAGQRVGFMLPLSDQPRAGIALGVDGIERAIAPTGATGCDLSQ